MSRSRSVQYGALPYRLSRARSIELLLITSRETKRWIIPKGWPIKGLKPSDAAAREAYQEAGLRGIVGKKPIGEYHYEKADRARGQTTSCRVIVFPLLVRRQRHEWPEYRQRKTKWVSLRKAASLVAEKGLRALILEFREGMRVDKLARAVVMAKPSG